MAFLAGSIFLYIPTDGWMDDGTVLLATTSREKMMNKFKLLQSFCNSHAWYDNN